MKKTIKKRVPGAPLPFHSGTTSHWPEPFLLLGNQIFLAGHHVTLNEICIFLVKIKDKVEGGGSKY